VDRLEYQRQGRCWGCKGLGHVWTNYPTISSKPLSILAIVGGEGVVSGKEET